MYALSIYCTIFQDILHTLQEPPAVPVGH